MDADRRELSRASTAAFDDAASFFGAGGTTSDGGYASSGAGGGRDGGGSSVTGGGAGCFGVDGADFDDDDDDRDDFDDRSSSLYSRSLSASPSRRSDITDPLDDFLKRYTISIMPEETVAKLKKRAGPLVLGINYCPQWDARVTYTAKPSARGAGPLWWIHKLSYSPGSGAGRRRKSGGAVAASSFSDDDDDDVFVEPLEAAAGAGSDASVSGSSVGGAHHRPRRGAAAAAAAPSTFSSSLRALGSRLPEVVPLRHGVATLTSPKLDLLSWLRLQVVADADLASGRWGFRWRVSTKWSTSPGRIGRKERWTVFEGAEIKPRWSVDLYTPEVTGTFGAPQRQLRRGGGARRRRRGAAAAAAAAATAGGSANRGSIIDDEAAAAAAAGPGGSAAASATDDEDDLGSASASASSLLSSSAATSFRGRRRGARGRGRAALDLGHCHLLVPRLDAVVDADAAALSLVRAAKFAAVTPLKVLAGIPLAAARRAVGQLRKGALPPPPLPAPPASSGGFLGSPPFVGPGGLALPPLPSFLSRSARFRATTAAPPPPPQFVVRGWPWSLGLADGLESAAGWLRRATEEAEARRRSGARSGASA